MDFVVVAGGVLLAISTLVYVVRLVDWLAHAEPRRVLRLGRTTLNVLAAVATLAAVVFLFRQSVPAAVLSAAVALGAGGFAGWWRGALRIVSGARFGIRSKPFRPRWQEAPREAAAGTGLAALSRDELVAHAAAVLASYVEHERALAAYRQALALAPPEASPFEVPAAGRAAAQEAGTTEGVPPPDADAIGPEDVSAAGPAASHRGPDPASSVGRRSTPTEAATATTHRARRPLSRSEALRILGLPEGAGADEIADAHRRLASLVHPSSGGSAFLLETVDRALSGLARRDGAA